MPHDIISPELSPADVDDLLTPSPEKRRNILSAFRAAGEAVVKPIKRAGAKAVLSAMIVAAAALCVPQEAKAQATIWTYSSQMNDCAPGGSNPCAYGDLNIVYTGSIFTATATSLGNPVFLSSFGLSHTGNIATAWNVTAGDSTTGAEGNTVSPPANIGVGSPVYAWGWLPHAVGIAYSFSPGTWSIGPPISGKTLGSNSGGGQPNGSSGGGGSGSAAPTANNNPFDGSCLCGDPINVATGNVFEQVTDYTTSGQNPLSFTRYYNSLGNKVPTSATALAVNWRSNYDSYLRFTGLVGSSSSVVAERPNGQQVTFNLVGSTWTPDTDVDMTLTNTSGSTWTLKDHNDNVETYTVTNNRGYLQSVAARNGYTQTLNYSGSQLSSVSDSYGRSLNFTYSGGLLDTVSTPDGLTLTYGFSSSGTNVVNPATLDQLASVSYSTSPVTSQQYLYEDANLPFAMTADIDENGARTRAWTYNDSTGQATSSQRGGTLAANLTTLTYNADGTTTVTNAFGVADTYTFSTLQGVPKVTQISRAATSTTAAATQSFGYDSNGYLNSFTDWNGNQTTYVNNAQGNPTTINYAVGSPVAYSVTISYDPTFTHLPHQIIAPGVTSTFVYDTSGNPLNRTDLDTTTNTIPYITNGQMRETQWTWSTTGELQTVQLPRTDVVAKTTFGYDSTGALTSIKDALNHLTQITAHTGGGLPQTVIDPNNVTTTLAYDGRLNLHTSTMATTAGNLTTTWTYDPANNLQSVQKPDGSMLTFAYNAAHQLTTITDLFGNSVNITPDALNDPTLIQVKNPSGTMKQKHSGTFDALGRVLTDVGGVSQTTSYTWDNNGNALTITPPSPQGTITRTYDALNRLATSVDPSPGGTTTLTYDSFNRLLNAQDANNNSTAYVYDGFGDRTQTASPDSGTTVFTYDPDRNLTKAALPGSITKNYTFDALDRTLTIKYTGDTTLNVTNTYDQATGHGFGIGRLTSAVDKVGTLSLTYDERGNVTVETRTPTGASALATTTGFDGASNVSSITYPSGTLVTYARDTMGRVTSLTAKPPGASSASNVATGVTYEPFGPVTGLTFGNGMTGTYGYDLDYRPTTRVDAGTATIQNLTYAYYGNDSVHTIADAVNAGNSQTMTYDTLDRIKTAASGTGGYGSYSWTWDPVSNVKTQVINGTTTTFTDTAGTNKISKFVTSGTTETVTTSASGNITAFKIGTTAQETLAYNKANQMASSTSTSSSATYEYDGDGQRLVKSPPGSNSIYYQFSRTGKELLSENDQHAGQTADYIYLNGRPIGEVNPTNGKLYFTSTDRLGTPQTLTDNTQTVVWNALFAPFGNNPVGGVTGTIATQSLRLPGQQFDPESGYNHNGFRDYAGTLTRYVQTDPIGLAGGMNTYQYASGNPFKNIDPKGLDDSDFFKMPFINAECNSASSTCVDLNRPIPLPPSKFLMACDLLISKPCIRVLGVEEFGPILYGVCEVGTTYACEIADEKMNEQAQPLICPTKNAPSRTNILPSVKREP